MVTVAAKSPESARRLLRIKRTLWAAWLLWPEFLLFVLAVLLAVTLDPVVLWILMPLVVFGSAFVPEIASFTAGQAAFTMIEIAIALAIIGFKSSPIKGYKMPAAIGTPAIL